MKPAGISLGDRERVSLAVHARRVPRQAWSALSETQALVEQANRLWQNVHDEVQALRADAHAQGLAQGRAEAVAETAELLLAAQRQARELLDAQEARVVALATAMVARIAPRLDAAELVRQLAGDALRELRGERHLSLSLHPDTAAELRGRLPGGEAFQLIEDAGLHRLGVVVESEQGQLVAGFMEQLQVLADGLQRSAQERAA